MSRILTLNLDFVLILQGGLLLMLATASWGRSQRDAYKPWLWFGWYAPFQACRTGLDLAVYENSAPPLFAFLDEALGIGAALSLMEFARTSLPRSPGLLKPANPAKLRFCLIRAASHRRHRLIPAISGYQNQK